ncbi:MAG: hypothetical protein GX491_19175 [Chloroflexi bacterium]|nr:hypothetical protein [Chloroflexota bacterium]
MKHIFLPFIILLLLLGLPAPALADIAPPPPPEGANIAPGSAATQVRMTAETVLVEIAQNRTGIHPSARVTARFEMLNQGSQPEQMDARFPLNALYPRYQSDPEVCVFPLGYPEISDFSARVDGLPAAVTIDTQRIEDTVTFSGETKTVACWARFPVTFPPGQPVTIEVAYTVQGYFAWTV